MQFISYLQMSLFKKHESNFWFLHKSFFTGLIFHGISAAVCPNVDLFDAWCLAKIEQEQNNAKHKTRKGLVRIACHSKIDHRAINHFWVKGNYSQVWFLPKMTHEFSSEQLVTNNNNNNNIKDRKKNFTRS